MADIELLLNCLLRVRQKGLSLSQTSLILLSLLEQQNTAEYSRTHDMLLGNVT